MSFAVPSERLKSDIIGVYQYIGTAPSGSLDSSPVWQILRLTLSGSDVIAIDWADGNQSYDNVWDDRFSKVYS